MTESKVPSIMVILVPRRSDGRSYTSLTSTLAEEPLASTFRNELHTNDQLPSDTKKTDRKRIHLRNGIRQPDRRQHGICGARSEYGGETEYCDTISLHFQKFIG